MLDVIRRTAPADTMPALRGRRTRPPWWTVSIAAAVATAIVIAALLLVLPEAATGTPRWWALTIAMHTPFAVILLFLGAGAVERVGFFWRGRVPSPPGRLPVTVPAVCVQLPLFNEHAVADRIIAAAGALRWPDERLELQVLDDSTDPAARASVDRAVEALRARRGISVEVIRRAERHGYKAGALEEGRRATAAEFIAIFDADFMPTPDFLQRTMPHFFRADGLPDDELALVQAQWGHLNPGQSALTRAQSLWVDDHHTVQMSWRSARWRFVNFTGTAGIWRAEAIERAGGWRATSLVEDCELSFRHLFAGYRTAFVRDVVAPAELPATYTAYKAQQRRWTQGWAQVQRLHLVTLARRFDTTLPRRLHLLYHMCIPWQWPIWGVWIALFPALIHTGLWFGAAGFWAGVLVYLAPMTTWLLLSTVVASVATPGLRPRRGASLVTRLGRVVPYVVLNTGMLPHQLSAFVEGAVGPLHSEFERTPKTAATSSATSSVTSRTSAPRSRVRIHWPYVVTEACWGAYQFAWTAVFLASGQVWPALGALFVGVCILGLGAFYGDHAGRMFFVIDVRRLREEVRRGLRPPGSRAAADLAAPGQGAVGRRP